MSSKYILTRKSRIQKRGDLCGTKAKNLARLYVAGFNVPNFFVLNSRAFEHRQELFEHPDILRAELLPQLETLSSDSTSRIAARSSATFEDSVTQSHAGQLTTVLNLQDWPAVFQAIQDIWGSVHQKHLKFYSKSTQQSTLDNKIAIIFQRQIESQVSGVLFTKHPLMGQDSAMLIELVKGSCDNLVSGRVAPTQIVVNRETLEIIKKSDVDTTIESFISTHFRTLVETALKIENVFSSPQDIEWTFDGKQIWLLQSRPITTYSTHDRIVTERDGSQWTDYFFAERFVEPVSPLGWSYLKPIITRTAFQDPLWYLGKEKLFRHQTITKCVGGKPHARLDVFQTLYAHVPFWLISLDKKLSLKLTRQKWFLNILKSSPFIISRFLLNDFSWFPFYNLRKWNEFETHVQSTYDRLRERLPQASKQELATIFKASHRLSLLFLSIHRWSITFADIFVFLLKKMATTFQLSRDTEFPHYFYWLEENATLQANLALIDLDPNSEASVETFMKHFGHRSGSLDIASPTWYEQPEHVFQLATQAKKSSRSLRQSKIQSTKTRHKLVAQSFSNIQSMPFYSRMLLYPSFKLLLILAQKFYLLRENQRNLWHKILFLSRLSALQMAKIWVSEHRLKKPDDVFYLHMDEFLRLDAFSPTIIQRRISDRKIAQQGFSAFNSTNTFKKDFPSEHQNMLIGIGVSEGQFRGKARVTKRYEDAVKSQRNEILVVPSVEPAWSPIFASISGLVMETGGILSHASIIAREFHLPTITGISQATSVIQTGDILSIDGKAGTVEIVKKAAGEPT